MKGVFFSNFADINYIGLVYIDDRKWNIVKKKKKKIIPYPALFPTPKIY